LLVSLGRIVKTQGLKGALRVYPHSQGSENLTRLKRITIVPPTGPQFISDVISCRPKGMLYMLQLRDVVSVDQAQTLVGGEVLAEESDLRSLEGREFYWYEVIGMRVVTDEGEDLGAVASVIPTGANDVLQVVKDQTELLLPNIPEVILNIDRAAKTIEVHLLPGLR